MVSFTANKVPTMTKIVIVDDHASIIEMMTAMIEALTKNKVVGIALDAANASETCERANPDVVVLDWILSGTNTQGVLLRLKKICPKAKVIIFSGHMHPTAIRVALEAGAQGIVEKMAPFHELHAAIEAVTSGRSYFSPNVSRQIKEIVRRRPEQPTPVAALSKREATVLRCLALGFSSRETALQLGISAYTVVNHRCNLMRKIGARRAAQLSLYAAQIGLVDPMANHPGPEAPVRAPRIPPRRIRAAPRQ
jgi:DNA-binding NarL/FixJ family response regulator